MAGVLAVLYLIFNEGYLSTTAASVREDLCIEAIRLTRQLREASASLGPQPEVLGLLALMLLLDARRPARVRDGVLVTLPDQDRSAWNSDQIEEGHALVRQCLALNRPGLYQIQAAINAVHTDAPDASSVDWSQVIGLLTATRSIISPSTKIITHDHPPDTVQDGPSRTLRMDLRITRSSSSSQNDSFHARTADPVASRCQRCRRLSCPRSCLFSEGSGPATALMADGENPSETAAKATWKAGSLTAAMTARRLST
jgi:RNA polymerase sigma-70 factor, ECF subfamily